VRPDYLQKVNSQLTDINTYHKKTHRWYNTS